MRLAYAIAPSPLGRLLVRPPSGASPRCASAAPSGARRLPAGGVPGRRPRPRRCGRGRLVTRCCSACGERPAPPTCRWTSGARPSSSASGTPCAPSLPARPDLRRGRRAARPADGRARRGPRVRHEPRGPGHPLPPRGAGQRRDGRLPLGRGSGRGRCWSGRSERPQSSGRMTSRPAGKRRNAPRGPCSRRRLRYPAASVSSNRAGIRKLDRRRPNAVGLSDPGTGRSTSRVLVARLRRSCPAAAEGAVRGSRGRNQVGGGGGSDSFGRSRLGPPDGVRLSAITSRATGSSDGA